MIPAVYALAGCALGPDIMSSVLSSRRQHLLRICISPEMGMSQSLILNESKGESDRPVIGPHVIGPQDKLQVVKKRFFLISFSTRLDLYRLRRKSKFPAFHSFLP